MIYSTYLIKKSLLLNRICAAAYSTRAAANNAMPTAYGVKNGLGFPHCKGYIYNDALPLVKYMNMDNIPAAAMTVILFLVITAIKKLKAE